MRGNRTKKIGGLIWKMHKNCARCYYHEEGNKYRNTQDSCTLLFPLIQAEPVTWSTHISGSNETITEVRPAIPCPKPYNGKKNILFQKYLSRLGGIGNWQKIIERRKSKTPT